MGVKTLYVFRSRTGKTHIGLRVYEGLVFLAAAFKVPHEFPKHWSARKKIKALHAKLKPFQPGDLVEIKSRNPWKIKIMHDLGLARQRRKPR